MRFFEDFSSHLQSDAPSVIGIQITGRYGKLYSTYYIAKGNQLNPTLIFCHGFPGHEQMIDLAQYLRYHGYNVMTFHYSGSWGSGGPYAFRHCVRDTETVLDFVIKNAEKLHVDINKLGIFGHGVGAFVAGHVYADRKELHAAILSNTCDLGEAAALTSANHDIKQQFIQELKIGASWLKGTTGDILYNELIENVDSYRLTSVAREIIGRPILTLSSTKDMVVPEKVSINSFLRMFHHLEEVYKIDQQSKACHITLDTDHYQSDMRMELFRICREFLENTFKQ